MAVRKFLFLDQTEGFATEQAAADELSIGKLTLVGILGVAVDAGTNKIVGVVDPTDPQDAATKAYVDLLNEPSALTRGGSGLAWKPDGTRGLAKDASGGYVKLETDGGLSFNISGALKTSSAPGVRGDFIAGEDLLNGDAVYQSGTSTVSKGDPTNDAKCKIIGVVDGASGSGSDVKVITSGPATITGATFTPGATVFMGAAGRPTTTVPGASNHIYRLGWAKTATVLFVELQDLGKKA
jgi:hypothetical protein